MDAPEEDLDVKLQKISSDLVTEFDKALPSFLRKTDLNGNKHVRERVTHRDASRLTSSYLEPFQELPQLLDPYLPKWLPQLAEAFLESLQTRGRARPLSSRSPWLMPLRAAICRLIYTFCKIRGEKVVVGFLNVEARYLELLLSALGDAERAEPGTAEAWTWEERYVVLLWLSQLFLAPFDLATISSTDIDDEDLPAIRGFQWPQSGDVPGITVRVLPLAMKYLSSPGKERDAAKALLVRIAMRRDMQQLGILDALVKWALSSLHPVKDEPVQSPYHYIGALSFLAGMLVSATDSSDMDAYLAPIFYATHAVTSGSDPLSGAIVSSALARKVMIKVIRSIAVQVLRKPHQDMAGTELVETTIGYLLECLADNDTPVRLAASKALSIITLKLDEDMASQVIDAVLESLNRNVLWVKDPSDPAAPRTRDLTSVNPLEWHGLMLTLSHLLYRRSPPAEKLSDVIHALLLGLSFERRSTSGSSVGTNVRDAACFGIWALARRYSTAELLAVPTRLISRVATKPYPAGASILQVLATELAVTASLDPAGNIRRGSSAALQELIGRHPDTVEKGIWVVQTVDYHAVALRSRAISEVAMNVTKLAAQYGEALLEALLGWRGIGDSDPAARRSAAAAFGKISAQLTVADPADPLGRCAETISMITKRLQTLQQRQVEERHGLLLTLAAVLDSLPDLVSAEAYGGKLPPTASMGPLLQRAMEGIRRVLEDCGTGTFRRPELVAEAASSLVVSSFPVLQAAVLGPRLAIGGLVPGPSLISRGHPQEVFDRAVSTVDSRLAEGCSASLVDLRALILANLDEWLKRPEEEVITAASEAALILLVFCDSRDRGEQPNHSREALIRQWAERVRRPPTSGASTGFGFFFALTMAHPILPHLQQQEDGAEKDNAVICRAILDRWAGDRSIETRVALLRALAQSEVLEQNVGRFLGLIAEGLDDYTTNARGDVGSHVRLQAIRATKSLWQSFEDEERSERQAEDLRASIAVLFLRILRLAAEKLDRVRSEAQATLALTLEPTRATKFRQSTFSSRAYFRYLLDLRLVADRHLRPAVADAARGESEGKGETQGGPDAWMEALMSGFVTSADTGNEELVIASRAALADFCEASPANLARVCAALVHNLKTRQGQGQDRVVVPTLEIIAYLFYAGLFPRCGGGAVDYKALCLRVQRAGYKTGNVRKLEACVKVYGAVAGLSRAGEEVMTGTGAGTDGKRAEGIKEARRRLAALLQHPWPRIRSTVVDELWGLVSGGDAEGEGVAAAERLKGVDWGRASKEDIQRLVGELRLS